MAPRSTASSPHNRSSWEDVPWGVIEDFHDITERKRAEMLAQHLATHDALTGLPNRLLFTDRLEVALAQAERGDTRPVLMFCDVDGFKAINDSHGHVIGDDVLRATADALLRVVRQGDTVARLGGDEFVVLFPQGLAPDDALAVGRKLLAAVDETTRRFETYTPATLSIGIAFYEPGDDADSLVRRADEIMYEAKRAGGHGVLAAAAPGRLRAD